MRLATRCQGWSYDTSVTAHKQSSGQTEGHCQIARKGGDGRVKKPLKTSHQKGRDDRGPPGFSGPHAGAEVVSDSRMDDSGS